MATGALRDLYPSVCARPCCRPAFTNFADLLRAGQVERRQHSGRAVIAEMNRLHGDQRGARLE
jgi:hypothetical protein